MTRAAETKRRIVDAAEEVVLREGVAKLTLEAAAAQAGLSKGGVLYHFPTRDSLVAGMVERIIEEFEHDLAEQLGGSDQTTLAPGAFTRAYVRATLAPGHPQPDRENRLGAALIAAVAAEPTLLHPLQKAFDRWQQRVEDDGIDPARATVLRLAADGLWLSELFGLAPLSAEQRAGVGAELDRLTREIR